MPRDYIHKPIERERERERWVILCVNRVSLIEYRSHQLTEGIILILGEGAQEVYTRMQHQFERPERVVLCRRE